METFHSIDEAIAFLRENMHISEVSADFPDAARFLGLSKDEIALAPLLEALSRGSSYMRAAAANGLGFLGRHEAIPALIKAFLEDPGLYVRSDAALALGRLGSDESLQHFIRRFPQEYFEVQKRILMAISSINTNKAGMALEAIEEMIPRLDMSESARETLRAIAQQKPRLVA
ncbi:MAG: HEAT repeat domain-containing protein [Chloroflexota bacterium]|nr:HEAT repeat domain-containing protein [Chloroflexota bacterium]